MSARAVRDAVSQRRKWTLILLAAIACVDVVGRALADAPVPAIAAFTAIPSKVLVGRSATLRWSVSDATRVAISHGVGVVTAKKEVSVRPPMTTRYFITASNANGSVTKAVVVSVSTSLTSTPPQLAPLSAITNPLSTPPSTADESTVAARGGDSTPQRSPDLLHARIAKVAPSYSVEP